MDDSGDYELLPQKEIDDLKRELASVKKNSLVEGDKGRVLIDSIDRFSISINRLITILDDAQKDIIEEYQDAKPAEKLNKLLEQNEMIAKALLSMNDKISAQVSQQSQSQQLSQQAQQSPQDVAGFDQMRQSQTGIAQQLGSQSFMQQGMQPSLQSGMQSNMQSGFAMPQGPGMGQSMQQQMLRQQQTGISRNPSMMPPLDDLPPLDDIPPMSGQGQGIAQMPPLEPASQKKKFLGFI